MSHDRPYALVLTCGGATNPLPDAATVDVTPAQPTPEAAVAALGGTGLTPADLRGRVLFVAAGTVPVAAAAYAAVTGFAQRRVDIAVGDHLLPAASVTDELVGSADAGKPPRQLRALQVGAEHDAVPSLLLTGQVDPADVSALRYARQVRLVASQDLMRALTEVVMVAALRVRGAVESWPVLADGDLSVGVDDDGRLVLAGVALEQVRREAVVLRRTHRVTESHEVVPALPPSARLLRLRQAAAVPVEETLARLGSARSDDTGLWRCPRPWAHRNGDANPSTRVADGLVRCAVCDTEPLDSLRLVMSVRRVTADEAADLLGV